MPVEKQQLIAADSFKERAGGRGDAEAAVRESGREPAALRRRNHDGITVAPPLCRTRRTAVIVVEGDVMGHQETDRLARTDFDREGEFVRVAAGLGTNLYYTRAVSIDPSAGIGRQLECGWHIEQSPGTLDLREHALSVGLKQTDVAAHRG